MHNTNAGIIDKESRWVLVTDTELHTTHINMKQLRFVSTAIYHEISPDVPVLVYSTFDKNYHFPQRSICKILHNKGHKSVAFVSGWNSSHEAASPSKLFNLKRP